jgi:ABC-type branched-subunit amino acid transport system ATPase component
MGLASARLFLGRVVRSGTPAELRQDQAIQQAYLGL